MANFYEVAWTAVPNSDKCCRGLILADDDLISRLDIREHDECTWDIQFIPALGGQEKTRNFAVIMDIAEFDAWMSLGMTCEF